MSRYSDITKISEKGISRLGTADLPVVEENNSDVLLITVICVLYFFVTKVFLKI